LGTKSHLNVDDPSYIQKKLSNPLNENSIKKKRLATIHCNPTAKRTLQYFIVNMKSMEEEKKVDYLYQHLLMKSAKIFVIVYLK